MSEKKTSKNYNEMNIEEVKKIQEKKQLNTKKNYLQKHLIKDYPS